MVQPSSSRHIIGQCQGRSQSLIVIHPAWYEDHNNQFLHGALFKAQISSIDSWVSQYIPPHGEFEKTPLGEVHVYSQGCQETHIVQCNPNLASISLINLEPRKIYTGAVYFAYIGPFRRINMHKINALSTIMGPSYWEHFLLCKNQCY